MSVNGVINSPGFIRGSDAWNFIIRSRACLPCEATMERMYRTFTATQLGVLDDLANHSGARETFFPVSADYTLSHDKLSCDDVFCMLI